MFSLFLVWGTSCEFMTSFEQKKYKFLHFLSRPQRLFLQLFPVKIDVKKNLESYVNFSNYFNTSMVSYLGKYTWLFQY